MLLCSWYSWRWKCGADWRPCWIEFTVSDYCDILIWTKKPSNTHAVSTQLSSDKRHTFRHDSDVGHSLLHGATCWVVWLAGHTEFYVLTSQNLQYFLFKFPFPKSVHVEVKSLPAHLPFCIVCYWCVLITSSFENLCLPSDTEQPCCSVRTESEVQIYLRW
jgi:hypothetical protein